jgi:hypothetical protein
MRRDAIEILSRLGDRFTFRERAAPIHHALRADYRIATLLLMLHHCGRGGRASLVKLHLLNWASRQSESRKALLDRLDGRLHFTDLPLKFDPSFNRAVDLARGEGLVERDDSQSITILPIGEKCVSEINADSTCMVHEKHFFGSVGKRITEVKMKQMINPTTIW